MGEFDFGAISVKQGGAQLPFERLDLERHRRLTQKHALGGFGNAAFLGGVAKATKLLETIVLIAYGVLLSLKQTIKQLSMISIETITLPSDSDLRTVRPRWTRRCPSCALALV